MAADDIGALDDEEKDLIRQRRVQRAQQAEADNEQRSKGAKMDDVKTSFQRLRDMVNGERPTRESNAEYRARKGGAASKTLLPE